MSGSGTSRFYPLLCIHGIEHTLREGRGGGFGATEGFIFLYGDFPATGHIKNCGVEQGAGVWVCNRHFGSPAGQSIDPRGGHPWEPLLLSMRPWIQLLALIWLSPTMAEGAVLACTAAGS